MKKLILVLILMFSLSTLVGAAYAQNPDATKSAENKAAERAKDRLEQLNSRRASKSADVKETRDEARRRAHVFGEITAISGTTMTIQTRSDENKTILTDTETKFLSIGKGGKKEIKLADLATGDNIAVVGIAKDESSGTGKFVVKLNKPPTNRHALFGEVKGIGDGQITVSHLNHKDKPTTTVKVSADTKIKIKGKESATISDIKVGDKVAASGTVDDKGAITAKRLFVIPGKATGAEPKVSTKSATPSATP